LRAGVAAALVVALGLAPRAEAFVRTHVDPNDLESPCLFWDRRTVPYQLSQRGLIGATDESPIFDSLRTSLRQWTDVACSDFAYEDQGLSQSVEVGFNKVLLNQPMLVEVVKPENTVLFRDALCEQVVPAGDACLDPANDDCASRFDCWGYGDGVIALTTTTYNFQTGEIFDGDIELNEAEFQFTTADPPAPSCQPGSSTGCIGTDLRNTVTHEAGHLLGLGHSGDPESTMFLSAGSGETLKRDLAQDDIDGLCSIYPAGKPPSTCGEIVDAPSGCSSAEGDLALPWLLVMLCLVRRRRT